MSPAWMYSRARRTAVLNCFSPPATGTGSGSPPLRKRAPLRQPLAPAGASPTEIADVTAGKRRQAFDALGALRFQRATEGLQRLRLLPQREPRLPGPHPDIAVAAERSLEEEGVSLLVLIEEAEDAERRQQITGKFDGRGRSASKAGSGKG